MKSLGRLPLLFAVLLAGRAHAAPHPGNGQTGFGGGSLQITDDATNGAGGNFNVYFDTAPGGTTAYPSSGEIGSPFVGRRAIVNEFGSGSDASFRSNEAFVFECGAANPGFNGATVTSYQTYTTVPEPAVAILGTLGVILLLRRRK